MRAALILCLVLSPVVVTAQQDERLPDLTPQEFEIRGDLQISLPDLQRQPLRGFAPPPRTYVVPADRQPHVAPYAQRLDDLPEDRLAPAVPPVLTGATPRIGQLDLMAGRYYGRRGRLTLNAGGFGLDALYHGFSEFTPGGADFHPVDSDNITGRASFTGGDDLLYTVAVDGAYHQYGLHGAVVDTLVRTDVRQSRLIGVEAALTGTPPVLPFTVGARFESAGLDDQVRDWIGTSPHPVIVVDENRLMFNGSVEAGPVGVSGRTALVGRSAPIGASLVDFDTGLTLGFRFGDASVRVGGAYFGFGSAPEQTGRRMLRFGPLVEVDAPLGNGLRLYAWNRAGTQSRGLMDVLRANPYVRASSGIEPDVHIVNAEAGFEIQSAPVMIALFGGARLSPNELYFARSQTPASEPRLFMMQYEGTSTYRGGANVTVHGPADLSLSAGVEYRHARLTEQDRPVPFVAPLAWRFSAALPFDAGRGLVQASIYGEGVRPTEVEGETAPAWGDFGIEAHYRLAGRFGLVGRVDRLGLSAEQWPGFPQPGTMITAGVRAGW